MSWKAWLTTAIVCIVIEILPPPTHFFFLGVAMGAVGAAVAAYFSALLWLPWVVFVALTVVFTPLLIPLAKFLFATKPHASNADAVVGEKALVVERIDPKTPGVVKVHGDIWRAMSNDTIEKDQWVEVLNVEGTHVNVRRMS